MKKILIFFLKPYVVTGTLVTFLIIHYVAKYFLSYDPGYGFSGWRNELIFGIILAPVIFFAVEATPNSKNEKYMQVMIISSMYLVSLLAAAEVISLIIKGFFPK